jgi:hypothetical protein
MPCVGPQREASEQVRLLLGALSLRNLLEDSLVGDLAIVRALYVGVDTVQRAAKSILG